MEQLLLLKTWICHCFFSINRVIQYGTQKSMFFEKRCGECPPHNKDLLYSLDVYFLYILLALAGVGGIIDLLAIKYRSLANYYIYLENLMGVLVFFLPTKGYVEMSNFVLAANSLGLYIGFYCGTNTEQIASIVSVGVAYLVVRPICNYIPTANDPLMIVSVVGSWLMCAFVFCITSMAAIYISKLHNTVKTTNMENAKLLDGMHEGLLILSKKDRRTMFCNNTADKLLSLYLGAESETVQDSNLKKAVFGTVKLTMRDSDDNDKNKVLLSLEDIIIL